MNFEEMQNTWQAQFRAKIGTKPALVNARLLERILRNQRGYARTVVLMALKDVMALGGIVASLVFLANIGPRASVRFIMDYRICSVAWVAVLLILQVTIIRRMPGMLSIRADRSPLSLGGRVDRDARRFRLQMVWNEAKQVVISALMVAFAVVLTDRTGLQGPLRWIAVGLPAIPALTILTRRILLRSNRPASEQSISESIDLATQQTADQIRQMKRSRWYPPFYPVGIYLSLEPMWLRDGTIQPVGWVLLSIFAAFWIVGVIVNNWVIRGLLRPRLAELEGLRAGLLPVDPPAS